MCLNNLHLFNRIIDVRQVTVKLTANMKSYTLSVLHSCFFLLALKCHTCIFGFLEDINLLCEGLGTRAK